MTLTDKQLRLQVRYALARVGNVVEECGEQTARLSTIETALTDRIGDGIVVVPPPAPASVPAPAPAPVSALYPNRPEGVVRLGGWDGTSAAGIPCGSVQADGGGIVNPLGTGKSLRINYAEGSNGCGDDPVLTWARGIKTLYLVRRDYIDPAWDESQGQKLCYVFQNGGRDGSAYYYTREPGGDFRGQDNLGSGVNHLTIPNYWTGERGNWVTTEWVFAAETVYGSSNDATVTVFKNGAQKAAAKSVGKMGDLNGLMLYLTRNAPHTQAEYFLLGEFSAWGK